MKKIYIFALFIAFLLLFPCVAYSDTDNILKLTAEEQMWLDANRGKTFIMGLDPEAEIESFLYNGKKEGYIYTFVSDIEKQLGLKIKIAENLTMDQSINGLVDGKIDIVVGGKVNTDKLLSMFFTKPLNSVAYAVFARKDSDISTLGDVYSKKVGFTKDDKVEKMMKEKYAKLKYKTVLLDSNKEGINSVVRGEIDALVVPGGHVVYDYLHNYSSIKKVCEIENIKAEIYMSTSKNERILNSILNKSIVYEEQNGRLPKMIKASLRIYIQRVLDFTDEEINWLKNDGKVVFGVTNDYLPFDYIQNGTYKGISGVLFQELIDLMGFKPVYVAGDFSVLYDKLLAHEIDTLNVVKTEDRMTKMLFPDPYLNERDRIYGKVKTHSVFDISGLKGKRVAVIEGYYQIDMLEKNQIGAELVYFADIKKCILAVHNGKADYLIENAQVVNYYAEELGIYDLAEKGITSADTRLYFGINNQKPQLASILNKTIQILNIEDIVKEGLQTVPKKKSYERYLNFFIAIGGLILVLGIVFVSLYYLFNQLLKEKTEKAILVQKENLLYTDGLTGLYNRNYYTDKLRPVIDDKDFPQAVLVFDMNNLKETNDTYGHDIGDKILEKFGLVLSQNSEGGIGVRIGGDEFAMFIFGEKALRTELILDDFSIICEQTKIRINDEDEIGFNVASGCSIRYDADISLDELFRQADIKMYADKSSRKAKS